MGKVKNWLGENWFRICILLLTLVFLLIQWGNFNSERKGNAVYCAENFNNESCRNAFSLKTIFLPF